MELHPASRSWNHQPEGSRGECPGPGSPPHRYLQGGWERWWTSASSTLSRLQHGALSPAGALCAAPAAYRSRLALWPLAPARLAARASRCGGVAQGQLLCGVAAQGPRAVGVAVGPHLERGAVASQALAGSQSRSRRPGRSWVEQVVGGQGGQGTGPSTATRGSAPGRRMGWGGVASLLQLREQEVRRASLSAQAHQLNPGSRILAPSTPRSDGSP